MSSDTLALISDAVILAALALLGGFFSGIVAPVVLFILKDRSERRIRQEDRDDRERQAKLVTDSLNAIKVEGGHRERRITKQVMETKQVAIASVKNAKEAFKEANGVNVKIAALGQAARR